METADQILVRHFVRDGDGEAFATLMNRHARLVYGTCRRILGNDDQAADVAQETFFQFLKDAGRIQGSLGGWLHVVATRRAVDLVRQDTARRRREQAYATDALPQAETWEEIAPLVDESLEALPEPLRDLLILHFLERRTTIEIARALGVSQPTVSRRIATALERLRQNLRSRDVVVGLAGLQGLLANSTPSAPLPLLHSLGKMALAYAAASGTAKTASVTGPALALGIKIALATAALSVVVGGGWLVVKRGTTARAPNSVGKAASSPAADTVAVNAAQTKLDAADGPMANAPVTNPAAFTADVATPTPTNRFQISLPAFDPVGGTSPGGPAGFPSRAPQAGGIGGIRGGFAGGAAGGNGSGGFGSFPPASSLPAVGPGRVGFDSQLMRMATGGRIGMPPGWGAGVSVGGGAVGGAVVWGGAASSAMAPNSSFGSSMFWSGAVSISDGPAGFFSTNFRFGGATRFDAGGGANPANGTPRP